MKTKLITLALLFYGSIAQATIIELGKIDFKTTFRLNHLYNFNDTTQQPFGHFGTPIVIGVSGIFGQNVAIGSVLNFLNGNALWTDPARLPTWSISGFTFRSSLVRIAGADSGESVGSQTDSDIGNGYNVGAGWGFIAPPYRVDDFPTDVTGIIYLGISAWFDDGITRQVPDTVNTLLIFLLAITILFWHYEHSQRTL